MTPLASYDETDDTEALLCHYLNLAPDLTSLYKRWSTADSNFNKKAPKFAGVRILKQDAWEALIGFICSSNNNIIRISQMVSSTHEYIIPTVIDEIYDQMEKLCVAYGPLIGRLESTSYHDMPSPAALSEASVESHLRQLGFGYRAKYIHQTATMIAREHQSWLDGLRNPESPVLGNKVAPAGEMLPGGRQGYRSAHEKLLSLPGVGPKVADCVCLMGLGWGEAIPVDTHGNDVPECHILGSTNGLHMESVWQIAQRDYQFGKGKHRSLTKATYDAIGDHFRSLWGKEAGWAHSVLFTADLRAFSSQVVIKREVTEEADANGAKWEHLTSEGNDTKTDEGSMEKCDQTYSHDETIAEGGLKREMVDSDKADSDRAANAPEHVSFGGQAKRRRRGR